jgi:phosphopantothenoylcysteine decarboxylase / phosphopantothenate---cysteine ligase
VTRSDPDGTVLLGVCASVAAYKAVTVARELMKAGRTVQVVMSPRAKQFVGAATFSALTGRAPYLDLFQAVAGEPHVALSSGADCFLIAPATADCLARLAQGRADEPVSATALCFDGPLFVAPAMHPRMWEHPATEANVCALRQRGVTVLGPSTGRVASGDEGTGRMLEPEDIVAALLGARDLAGLRVIVTAGPTVEDIDPVRFISNRSSGKMGYALARRAAERGASVDLVSGPVALSAPPGVAQHSVRSALEMQRTLQSLWERGTDCVIMAAAVGDYRVAQVAERKLKRSGATRLELLENPDIIASLGSARRGDRPTLIAFAVETGDEQQVVEHARRKLQAKHVDLVVANHAADAFGTEDNRVHLVDPSGAQPLDRMPKLQVADRVLDWVRAHRAGN